MKQKEIIKQIEKLEMELERFCSLLENSWSDELTDLEDLGWTEGSEGMRKEIPEFNAYVEIAEDSSMGTFDYFIYNKNRDNYFASHAFDSVKDCLNDLNERLQEASMKKFLVSLIVETSFSGDDLAAVKFINNLYNSSDDVKVCSCTVSVLEYPNDINELTQQASMKKFLVSLIVEAPFFGEILDTVEYINNLYDYSKVVKVCNCVTSPIK